jgi:hypothetical protein
MYIEIPDELAAALTAIAARRGLTLHEWLGRLTEEFTESGTRKPLKTGRGMLATYGPAPTAAEIDENRREMFRNFAQDV